MAGEHLVSQPFVVVVKYGDRTQDGSSAIVNKTQQFNYADIGEAHIRFGEAVGWRGVLEVELVIVCKRVRNHTGRNWKSRTDVPVERRSLPPRANGI